MTSKYWLLVKSFDGRVIRSDSYGIVNDSGQDVADIEAMEQLGRRLVAEARARRFLTKDAA